MPKAGAAPILTAPYGWGAPVDVDGSEGIRGIVTGYSLFPNGNKILVDWWSNGVSRSEWFAEWRVTKAKE